MSKKRVKGKVLPFHTQQEEPAAMDNSLDIKGKEFSVDAQEASVECNTRPEQASETNRVELEVTVDLDPWSDEAWQASLTGVESDLVAELFGDDKRTTPNNEVTIEEMQWLLKSPDDVSDCESTDKDSPFMFGLPPKQLADAQKTGTLTHLLEYRYRKSIQFPVLDKVLNKFAAVASKRLHKISGQSCQIKAIRSARAPFDVWLRMDHPLATSFSMFPLEGVGVFGMEREVAVGLANAIFSAGEQESLSQLLRRLAVLKKNKKNLPMFPMAGSVVRHVLHLLLLDLEWALAPFYEVESIHGKADEPALYSKHFWLDEPCIACELSISIDMNSVEGSGAESSSGTMMIMFPEKMLEEILPILTGEQSVLVPELTEFGTSALERLLHLDNDVLRAELESQHPLSAAVILSQLSEDRRMTLIEKMSKDKREGIERRVGHRAGIEQVLSEPQQFVASVLALGESHAAQVLSSFSPEAAAGFLREAGKLPSLYPEQVNALLKSRNSSIVSTGALVVDSALVRRLMIRAVAAKDMAKVVALCRNDRVHMPFALILSVPVEDVVTVLRTEPVSIHTAVVLLVLETDREYAARLLAAFTHEEQQQIVKQLIHGKRIESEFVTLLENYLIAQLSNRSEKETLSMPDQEQWAVSGAVEWLLEKYSAGESEE
ncbi:hypothetical protein [Halodesulfovibrio marinisediminis]|uniref:FliG N-terminal domain-containing protein n=1 Tax=Halodesulfovibrio marinisediminis DSM 17456 TaxID=1121457 RepID=A0A1N6IVI3_9BACT|nr:hypothetical protein [Halodesulfovibrio marinisediminis]SIO36039.1 FliG N-terminal domain-containing protein [Halodesulfovibrio marinisediminis DSM 17456]